MSRENVEIVRRGHEAFQQGDLTAMLELLDPEVVCYTAAPLPDPGEYHGPEGLLPWIADWTEGFDDYVQQAEEYIEAGDHVIARVYMRATGTQSGVPIEHSASGFSTHCGTAKSCGSVRMAANSRPSKPPACRSRALTRFLSGARELRRRCKVAHPRTKEELE